VYNAIYSLVSEDLTACKIPMNYAMPVQERHPRRNLPGSGQYNGHVGGSSGRLALSEHALVHSFLHAGSRIKNAALTLSFTTLASLEYKLLLNAIHGWSFDAPMLDASSIQALHSAFRTPLNLTVLHLVKMLPQKPYCKK